jgi:hypothetical protein
MAKRRRLARIRQWCNWRCDQEIFKTNRRSMIQPGSSRRQFISRLAAISAGLTVAAPLSRSATTTKGTDVEGQSPKQGTEGSLVEINFKVYGHPQKLEIDPRVTLLDAIRDHSDLTGPKKGLSSRCLWHLYAPYQRKTSALSCLTLALMAQSAEITTGEGLAKGD